MNIIRKINKYLLEHYPLIWNTRLVWMLLINLFMHLFFFILGYLAVANMDDVKARWSLSDYYDNTVIVNYNILFSTLIILIWIVYYLRNNAFKNFYKLSSFALFKEFCILILIAFISVSQYLSFKQGLMLKIRSLYSWEEIDQDIKTLNRTGIFLTKTYSDYEIDKKKYPKPFPLKVASENTNDVVNVIDTTRAYFVYKGFRYQFFEIDQEFLLEYRKKNPYGELYFNNSDNFKHRIVKDVYKYRDHIQPNLRNYSKTLYSIGQDSLDYQAQLNYHEKILNQANVDTIKSELTTHLALLDKYEIDHNLTLDYWFPNVFNPPLYEVKELIRNQDPKKRYSYSTVDNNYHDSKDKYTSSLLLSETFYCNLDYLDNLFKNVYYSYFVESETEFISIILAIVIFFGLILYIFKTTSLRSLLFSIVSFLLLLVIVIMMMSYTSRIYDYRSNVDPEQIVMIAISLLVIVFAVISYVKKFKKLVSTILFSLSLYAFPLFVLFVCLRISKILNDANDYITDPFTLWFNEYGYWFVISCWILGIFIYSRFIKELNSRPE